MASLKNLWMELESEGSLYASICFISFTSV